MPGRSKTNQDLIKENDLLKQRVQELEDAEARHRQEDDELKSSRQLLRLLIDAGPDFFFLKDLNLQYQLVNTANANFFGLDESDILGKSDLDLMPKEAALACRESDRMAINEKRTVITIESVGGRFYETYKFPIIISSTAVGVAGIIRDITTRKQMEEDLRESRQFLYDLIEHSGALICVKDRDGRYEIVNSKWEAVTGLTRKDTVGRTDEELFPGTIGRQFRSNDLEVMELGSVLEKEEILETENGNRYFISIKFPLRDNNGIVSGICGMITEITARKLAEEALINTEARYRLLFEQSPDGILIIDTATAKPLEFNETAHKQLGYTREEFSNISIFDLEVSETPAEIRSHIEKVIREGRSDFDTVQRNREGETRNVHVTAQIVEILGKPFYHCIWRDITDRKRAEQERESLISELKKALSEIKTLSGLVPICSSCKKIRNDKGYWQKLEAYLCEHSDAEFSHGICPECARKLYPDLYPEE